MSLPASSTKNKNPQKNSLLLFTLPIRQLGKTVPHPGIVPFVGCDILLQLNNIPVIINHKILTEPFVEFFLLQQDAMLLFSR